MKQVGRPSKQDLLNNNDHARERLLLAAQQCFSRYPYQRVTTRMLASKADVNPALIRYYFINKEGLYRAMFDELTDLMIQEVINLSQEQPLSIDILPRAFYYVVEHQPYFPMLLIRELILGCGKSKQILLDKIKNQQSPYLRRMIETLKSQGTVRTDISTEALYIHILSLCLFPWLIKNDMDDILSVSIADQFPGELLTQSIELLKHGCSPQKII